MAEIEVRNSISPEELCSLYESVGWSIKAQPELCRQALANTSEVFSAYSDNVVVGMVRVATDRTFFAYIIDMVVRPDMQREGVGGELVTTVLSKCREWGFEANFGELNLFAAQNADKFFKLYDFQLTGNGMYYKFKHLRKKRPTTTIQRRD